MLTHKTQTAQESQRTIAALASLAPLAINTMTAQTNKREQIMQWLLNNEGAANEIRKNFPRSGGFAISGNSYLRVKGEMKKATDYLKEAGFEHGQHVCMHRVIYNDADAQYPERFVFFPLKVADAPDFE